MKVKICGITTEALARQVAALSPDYIGFVFARSKRQVHPDQAQQLIAAMQEDCDRIPKRVGVFGHPNEMELEQVVTSVSLDIVQFHLPDDVTWIPSFKQRHQVALWLTIPVPSISDEDEEHTEEKQNDSLFREIFAKLDKIRHSIDGLLLDTHDPLYGGGSGKTFRWEVIPEAARIAKEWEIPLFAAGGLTPDNVTELLHYPVYGVDVSSGVESNGVKEIDKVKQFIERVRSHDQYNNNLSLS